MTSPASSLIFASRAQVAASKSRPAFPSSIQRLTVARSAEISAGVGEVMLRGYRCLSCRGMSGVGGRAGVHGLSTGLAAACTEPKRGLAERRRPPIETFDSTNECVLEKNA